MKNHPHLAELYTIYKAESQLFRKVHRMIDLFESIIKTHTVVIMSSYVNYNKLSDAAKGLVAQGLRTPSLGTWQLFSRVLFEELEKDNYNWLLIDFAFEFAALDKALNIEKTNVIALRNGYAHGATPTDVQCEADIKKFEPFLTQLLESKWLNASSLAVRNHKVYLVCKAGELTLHPMLLFRNEESESSFAFFNDLKNDKIGLLNYPLSKHYREKDFFTEFHEHLPLNDWKKTGNNEFYQRIEELTETFKGRTIEREKLLQFVLHNHKGYFSIQGNPGIGKSALIAQFFKDLRSHAEVKKLKVIEYFIRLGTQQAQVEYMFNYLIRRTDEVFPAGKEIRAEGKMVFDLQYQLFAKWRLWSEQANGQQLLFLIDGLDEGVENNVVTYLPRENFDNILIIYGSRPGGHKTIDDLWATLPVENHSKLELSGLGKEDIRALIYEVANKYEVERESDWIDAVQKRSQGNPLYLKLLCDAIENGSIEINDINALPEKIDEYYKAILQRYAQDIIDGDALLTGLFTFAAAKDYLTMAHLGLINKLGSATVQRIGSTLKEVLYENPLTEEVLDYQLFHESFREYLVKEKAKEVSDAAGRIIDFCNTWQELEGSWEQRYPLEQYASHLFESKQGAHHETLIDLIYNKAFASEQMKVLKTFDASNRLYQLALLKASDLNKEDQMLEAALCLVDLKYEEANDAPQVVAMVANGEMELALKRIERFGGADEEGVKRKFILYMLCLMELTLLNSKEKPFRKSAIEKLLNHLDEQIPADNSLIKWNDFFPSYLMFLMACEWANMGLDYLIVYKRTNYWKTDWIKEKCPYIDIQFEVLLECAREINTPYYKNSALRAISIELAKQGKNEEALACALDTKDLMISALTAISSELAKQGKNEEADSAMKEALDFARCISSEWTKSLSLRDISSELAKQGKIEEAASALKEALACARCISSEKDKSFSLRDISSELSKQGSIEEAVSVIQEALACARCISSEKDKSFSLRDISSELAKQGNIEEAVSVIQEALTCAQAIIDDYDRSLALRIISTEFAKQGKLEEAQACVLCISSEMDKSITLIEISHKLAKQERIEEAVSVMQDALICAQISDDYDRSQTLSEISTELVKQGKLEEALAFAKIGDDKEKSYTLGKISTELINQGNEAAASSVMKEAITCTQGISDYYDKCVALETIFTELVKQGKVEEASSSMKQAITCALGISQDFEKSYTLGKISNELAKQGKVEEAAFAMYKMIECSRGLNSDYFKANALQDISVSLAKQGYVKEAFEYTEEIIDDNILSDALIEISINLVKQGQLKYALSTAASIFLFLQKSIAFKEISKELFHQGQLEEASSAIQIALLCAQDIVYKEDKSFALASISTELIKQGQLDESDSVIQEALVCSQEIERYNGKSRALEKISTELVKRGKIEESIAFARKVGDIRQKCSMLASISSVLSFQGKSEESSNVMEEAINIVRDIKNNEYFYNSKKNCALKDISTELAMQGDWQYSESIGLEILLLNIRHDCWKNLGWNSYKDDGWQKALQQVNQLQNEEARLFYLKGWAENVSVCDATPALITEALPFLVNDAYSIEIILYEHALHEVVFNAVAIEKIKQLNSTLNIQWFLDIYNSLQKSPTTSRLSTNLDTWLYEIEDEDDQDQITLWAKQVTKGKITEEEFQTRTKDI